MGRQECTAITMASCSPSLRKAAESIRPHVQFSDLHRSRQHASIPSQGLPQPYPRKFPMDFPSREVTTRPHRSTNAVYEIAPASSTADPRSPNGWPQTPSPLSRLASRPPYSSKHNIWITQRPAPAPRSLESPHCCKEPAEKHDGIPALTTGVANGPTYL